MGFEDEDQYDQTFLAAAQPPEDPVAQRARAIRVLALQARAGARCDTTQGPGVLDRATRDGLCFVWFGKIVPSVYWSRTVHARNVAAVDAHHAAIAARSQDDPMPVLRTEEARVAKAEVEARRAAGEDIIFVASNGSRIVQEVDCDTISVSDDEIERFAAVYDEAEARRTQASPKRR